MLFEIYNSLANRFPESCPHLFGSVVEGYPEIWLSINSVGHPFVLFEASENDAESDLKLQYIEAQFLCPCDITLETGTTKSGTYSIITLRDDDVDIVRVFLRLLEESFLFDDARHDGSTVRRKILEVSELFSRLEISLRDVVGLWGELYLLTIMHDIDRAVHSWCLSKTAQFDFVTDTHVFEVKSTLKSRREHRFSLEQLRPSGGITVYVVSILLTEISSGKTVGELMDEIYGGISNIECRKLFFRQCLSKGGKDIYSSGLRLGVYPERGSIAVYSAGCLPVPEVADGDPITKLRFDVDITELPAQPRNIAEQLIANLAPQTWPGSANKILKL